MRGPFGGEGWDYPPGSMVGSGINSYEYEYEAEEACTQIVDGPLDYGQDPLQCGFVGEVEIHVDDYGVHRWTCPECLTEHEFS